MHHDEAVVATSTDKPGALKRLDDPIARREFFLIAAQKLRARLRAGVPAKGAAGYKVMPVADEVAAKVTAETLERLFPSGSTDGVCHFCGKHATALTAQLFATPIDDTLDLVACCRRCMHDMHGRKRVPRQPTESPRKTTYSVWSRTAAAQNYATASERVKAFKELMRVRKTLSNSMGIEEMQRILTPEFFVFTECEAKALEFNKKQRELLRDGC
jgi:hypothetical protein